MATVTLSQARARQFGSAPYGNLSALAFQLKTSATGGAIGADSTAPIASGDKVVLGILPEGFRLDDAQILISVGMTVAVTGSLGFEYDDGVDVAAVPQDPAYFNLAAGIATIGRVRATGSKLVTLPKAAKLILTTGGAANAKASQLDVLVYGELTGAR